MLVSALALGLIAGIALGGSWRRLGSLELRWWPALLVALGLRLLGLVAPLPLALYLAALVGVGLVALANRRLPGAVLIAVGSALNTLVVVLNGGMPVDMALAREVGALTFENDRLHVPLSDRTLLPFLSDVIPVALVRNVYSLGDVVVAVGGFWLPFAWLRRP